MKRYGGLPEKWTHCQIMFKNVKTHDYRERDLVGSTSRERRGYALAGTTYINPFAVCVHNENSDDIWSICTYLLTHGFCYAIHVLR